MRPRGHSVLKVCIAIRREREPLQDQRVGFGGLRLGCGQRASKLEFHSEPVLGQLLGEASRQLFLASLDMLGLCNLFHAEPQIWESSKPLLLVADIMKVCMVQHLAAPDLSV